VEISRIEIRPDKQTDLIINTDWRLHIHSHSAQC
jgi:hypothetical protein